MKKPPSPSVVLGDSDLQNDRVGGQDRAELTGHSDAMVACGLLEGGKVRNCFLGIWVGIYQFPLS
jgi:hypothetical protein